MRGNSQSKAVKVSLRDGSEHVFPSASHAAAAFGCSTETIRRAARGENDVVQSLSNRFGCSVCYSVMPLPDELWLKHPVVDVWCSSAGRIFLVGKGTCTYGTDNLGRCLSVRIGGKRYPVHVLIMEVFFPEDRAICGPRPAVMHLDGDYTNNMLYNLQWMPLAELLKVKIDARNTLIMMQNQLNASIIGISPELTVGENTMME